MQHTHDGALGLQAPARRISCNGTSQAALVEGAECMTFAVWEGKGDATGTEVVAHHQERAMPKPLSQQATWAPRVSVPPLVALTQPRMAQIGWLLDSYFYRTREDPRGPERTREDRRTREDPRGPERTREDPRGPERIWGPVDLRGQHMGSQRVPLLRLLFILLCDLCRVPLPSIIQSIGSLPNFLSLVLASRSRRTLAMCVADVRRWRRTFFVASSEMSEGSFTSQAAHKSSYACMHARKAARR